MFGPLTILESLPSGAGLEVEMVRTDTGRDWQVTTGPDDAPFLTIHET